MRHVLVVSAKTQETEFLLEVLSNNTAAQLTTVPTCEEAFKRLQEHGYALCIINGPLEGEKCLAFAQKIAGDHIMQVLLLAPESKFCTVEAAAEPFGIFTLAKPTSRKALENVLRLCQLAHRRIEHLAHENADLQHRVMDERLIARAKCVLVQYLGMTEAQAHKHLERQAMDLRLTKAQVAHNVLQTYDGINRD